ncbi:MAG TPA: protease pro-enzyme activation domain-containing protein [Terriglobales bacterium]|nr:protease pro-enzyme activation domain-containing protein [Terriglobales bacterium]
MKLKLLFALGMSLAGLCSLMSAQTMQHRSPMLAFAKDRVVRPIDDEQRVTLRGNLHPLAQAQFRLKPVPPDFSMERMMLVLNPDPEQQVALDELVEQQHDPTSPYYHQWLTPEKFGQLFGASEGDVNAVVNWIQAHGMVVEDVSLGRRSVIFSGNAGQVAAAFHTRIQTYKVNGELHHANDSDPEIPKALAGVVGGVVSLHDFQAQPMHVTPAYNPVPAVPSPNFSSGSSHYLSPADFAVIYNLNPLYQNLNDGSGQNIAIVGRSNINLSDVRSFRSNFGLPTKDPQVILNGADPGVSDANELSEATLDVEWSGAVAKNATVKFVVSKSTSSSDGVYLSAQYIVDHNTAPVMSVSFGLCEAALGSSGNNFINSLWQQAAAEGITVFVSSGDSGAAGCDSSGAPSGTHGRGVNGLCSSPYSVCVGGTQFDDTSNAGLYWSSFNASSTQASAQSYIPEKVWNESGNSGLWSGGGGVSTVYPKPSWQTGTGVPADNKRDVPDVSLTAAVHDGYLVYMNGGLMLLGGTSAASPSLAGIMSLVVQNTATPQGNANPIFYTLASRQNSGGAVVFHDTTAGNNTVPGVNGFNASTGYDQGSGLGSVDASMLVAHWSEGSAPPPASFAVSAPSTANLSAGATASVSASVSVNNGFTGQVALTASGLPTGVTTSFDPGTLAAPGTSTLTFTASSSVKAGTYAVTITATSGGTSKTAAVSLVVTVPATFTLATSVSSVTMLVGKSATVTATTTITSTFKSAVNVTVSGQPSGLTANVSPTSIKSPGSGSATLTISAAASMAPGTYTLTITASGGGVSRTARVTVNVSGFTLAVSPSTVTLAPGARGSLTVTTATVAGFNSAITFSNSALPTGITGSWTTNKVNAPGGGSVTLNLTRGSTAKVANSTITITASGGYNKTATFTLSVTAH